MEHNLFRQWVAGTLAAVFLVVNVFLPHRVEASFWMERQRFLKGESVDRRLLGLLPETSSSRARLSWGQENRLKKPFIKQGRVAFLAGLVPGQAGQIRRVAIPAVGSIEKVVLQIQDVHQNLEAQRNIGRTVAALIENGDVGLVGLEGSWGELDIKSLRAVPDKEARRVAAEDLLCAGEISGPVSALLSGEGPLPAVEGVDDPERHTRNVAAWRESRNTAATNREALRAEREELFRQKAKVFSVELAAFDRDVDAYRDDKMSLGHYLKVLKKHKPAPGPRTVAFLRALEMEERLDWKRVGEERTEVIRDFSRKAPPDVLGRVVQNWESYRSGGLGEGAYWRLFRDVLDRARVNLDGYPAFRDYLTYAHIAEDVNVEELYQEIGLWEKEIYDRLVKNDGERALLTASRRVRSTEKLLAFSLLPEEWHDYEGVPQGHKGLDAGAAETFYREAQARDEILAKNLLSAMDRRGAKTAVLVTGGFHSGGIEKNLLANGVSCVTVSPRVTLREGEKGGDYLTVFSQEKTPLERIFEGRRLFVAKDGCSPAAQAGYAVRACLVMLMKKTLAPGDAPAFLRQHAGVAGGVFGSVRAFVTERSAKLRGRLLEAFCTKNFDETYSFVVQPRTKSFSIAPIPVGVVLAGVVVLVLLTMGLMALPSLVGMVVLSPDTLSPSVLIPLVLLAGTIKPEPNIPDFSYAKTLGYLERALASNGGLSDENYDGIADRLAASVAEERRVDTALFHQANAEQSLVELVKNAMGVRAGLRGLGSKQILGQIKEGELILESSTDGKVVERFRFFMNGTDLRYTFERVKTDSFHQGTRITVHRDFDESEVTAWGNHLTEQMAVNPEGPIFLNGVQINQADGLTGDRAYPMPTGDPQVSVSMNRNQLVVEDWGKGMSRKTIFERWMNLNRSGNEPIELSEAEAKGQAGFRYKAEGKSEAKASLVLSGVALETKALTGRLNLSPCYFVVPQNARTDAGEQWNSLPLSPSGQAMTPTIAGIRHIIEKLTDPAGWSLERFAVVNTLAALLRAKYAEERILQGSLLRGDRATATDLLWYLRECVHQRVVDAKGHGEFFVPNLPGWRGFPGDKVVFLDPVLFDFVPNDGMTFVGQDSLFQEGPIAPGVVVYTADFGDARETSPVMASEGVVVIDRTVFTERRDPKALLDLVVQELAAVTPPRETVREKSANPNAISGNGAPRPIPLRRRLARWATTLVFLLALAIPGVAFSPAPEIESVRPADIPPIPTEPVPAEETFGDTEELLTPLGIFFERANGSLGNLGTAHAENNEGETLEPSAPYGETSGYSVDYIPVSFQANWGPDGSLSQPDDMTISYPQWEDYDRQEERRQKKEKEKKTIKKKKKKAHPLVPEKEAVPETKVMTAKFALVEGQTAFTLLGGLLGRIENPVVIDTNGNTVPAQFVAPDKLTIQQNPGRLFVRYQVRVIPGVLPTVQYQARPVPENEMQSLPVKWKDKLDTARSWPFHQKLDLMHQLLRETMVYDASSPFYHNGDSWGASFADFIDGGEPAPVICNLSVLGAKLMAESMGLRAAYVGLVPVAGNGKLYAQGVEAHARFRLEDPETGFWYEIETTAGLITVRIDSGGITGLSSHFRMGEKATLSPAKSTPLDDHDFIIPTKSVYDFPHLSELLDFEIVGKKLVFWWVVSSAFLLLVWAYAFSCWHQWFQKDRPQGKKGWKQASLVASLVTGVILTLLINLNINFDPRDRLTSWSENPKTRMFHSLNGLSDPEAFRLDKPRYPYAHVSGEVDLFPIEFYPPLRTGPFPPLARAVDGDWHKIGIEVKERLSFGSPNIFFITPQMKIDEDQPVTVEDRPMVLNYLFDDRSNTRDNFLVREDVEPNQTVLANGDILTVQPDFRPWPHAFVNYTFKLPADGSPPLYLQKQEPSGPYEMMPHPWRVRLAKVKGKSVEEIIAVVNSLLADYCLVDSSLSLTDKPYEWISAATHIIRKKERIPVSGLEAAHLASSMMISQGLFPVIVKYDRVVNGKLYLDTQPVWKVWVMDGTNQRWLSLDPLSSVPVVKPVPEFLSYRQMHRISDQNNINPYFERPAYLDAKRIRGGFAWVGWGLVLLSPFLLVRWTIRFIRHRGWKFNILQWVFRWTLWSDAGVPWRESRWLNVKEKTPFAVSRLRWGSLIFDDYQSVEFPWVKLGRYHRARVVRNESGEWTEFPQENGESRLALTNEAVYCFQNKAEFWNRKIKFSVQLAGENGEKSLPVPSEMTFWRVNDIRTVRGRSGVWLVHGDGVGYLDSVTETVRFYPWPSERPGPIHTIYATPSEGSGWLVVLTRGPSQFRYFRINGNRFEEDPTLTLGLSGSAETHTHLISPLWIKGQSYLKCPVFLLSHVQGIPEDRFSELLGESSYLDGLEFGEMVIVCTETKICFIDVLTGEVTEMARYGKRYKFLAAIKRNGKIYVLTNEPRLIVVRDGTIEAELDPAEWAGLSRSWPEALARVTGLNEDDVSPLYDPILDEYSLPRMKRPGQEIGLRADTVSQSCLSGWGTPVRRDRPFVKALDPQTRRFLPMRILLMKRWAPWRVYAIEAGTKLRVQPSSAMEERLNEFVRKNVGRPDWLKEIMRAVEVIYETGLSGIGESPADVMAGRFLTVMEAAPEFGERMRETLMTPTIVEEGKPPLEPILLLGRKSSWPSIANPLARFYVSLIGDGYESLIPEREDPPMPASTEEQTLQPEGPESLPLLLSVAKAQEDGPPSLSEEELNAGGVALLKARWSSFRSGPLLAPEKFAGAVNNQGRRDNKFIRELIQNAVGAVRRALTEGRLTPDNAKVRVLSFFASHGTGERESTRRWVVEVEDPGGVGLGTMIKKMLEPDVTGKTLADDVESCLVGSRTAEEKADLVVSELFIDKRQDPSVIKTIIDSGSEAKEIALAIVNQFGRDMRGTSAGRFGQGLFTVFGNADEVVLRGERGGKGVETKLRPVRDTRDGSVTGIQYLWVREYRLDHKIGRTAVRWIREIPENETFQAYMDNAQLMADALYLVGGFDAVEMEWNDAPLRDKLTPLATHGDHQSFTSESGLSRWMVRRLTIQTPLDVFPPEVGRTMGRMGYNVESPAAEPTRSRESIQNSERHLLPLARLGLVSVLELWKRGRDIPGLPTWEQYLRLSPWSGPPRNRDVVRDAVLLESAKDGTADGAWFREKYLGSDTAWRELLLSSEGERETMYRNFVPEEVVEALVSFQADHGKGMPIPPATSTPGTGAFSHEIRNLHLQAFARLWCEGGTTVQGMTTAEVRNGQKPHVDWFEELLDQSIDGRTLRDLLDPRNTPGTGSTGTSMGAPVDPVLLAVANAVREVKGDRTGPVLLTREILAGVVGLLRGDGATSLLRALGSNDGGVGLLRRWVGVGDPVNIVGRLEEEGANLPTVEARTETMTSRDLVLVNPGSGARVPLLRRAVGAVFLRVGVANAETVSARFYERWGGVLEQVIFGLLAGVVAWGLVAGGGVPLLAAVRTAFVLQSVVFAVLHSVDIKDGKLVVVGVDWVSVFKVALVNAGLMVLVTQAGFTGPVQWVVWGVAWGVATAFHQAVNNRATARETVAVLRSWGEGESIESNRLERLLPKAVSKRLGDLDHRGVGLEVSREAARRLTTNRAFRQGFQEAMGAKTGHALFALLSGSEAEKTQVVVRLVGVGPEEQAAAEEMAKKFNRIRDSKLNLLLVAVDPDKTDLSQMTQTPWVFTSVSEFNELNRLEKISFHVVAGEGVSPDDAKKRLRELPFGATVVDLLINLLTDHPTTMQDIDLRLKAVVAFLRNA